MLEVVGGGGGRVTGTTTTQHGGVYIDDFVKLKVSVPSKNVVSKVRGSILIQINSIGSRKVLQVGRHAGAMMGIEKTGKWWIDSEVCCVIAFPWIEEPREVVRNRLQWLHTPSWFASPNPVT